MYAFSLVFKYLRGLHNNFNYLRSRIYVRDRKCSELVILLIPTDIFANKISETCRSMVQSCLVSV
jgi:hypothetical protein